VTAKVRIKAGPVEFEYEGETELGLADIKDLFTHIETLFKVPVLAEAPQAHAPAAAPANAGTAAAATSTGQKLHINSVATKLKVKTGPDLAVAAAAALMIYEKKETFSRANLLEMMKKATMHYKDNMNGNLTKILGTLVGSKFNQVSDGVYSLTADAYHQLEAQLA
jgi:hypothetical protein